MIRNSFRRGVLPLAAAAMVASMTACGSQISETSANAPSTGGSCVDT